MFFSQDWRKKSFASKTRIEFRWQRNHRQSCKQTHSILSAYVMQRFPLRLMTNSRNKHYLHLLPRRVAAEAISDRFILFSFRVNSLLTNARRTRLGSAASRRPKFSEIFARRKPADRAENWNQRKLSADQVESHQSLFWNQRRFFVTVQSGFRVSGVWLRRDQPHSCAQHSHRQPDDLSMEVTSCKGRGCCWFSLLSPQHTPRRSPASANECGLTGFSIGSVGGRYFSMYQHTITAGKHKRKIHSKRNWFHCLRWTIFARGWPETTDRKYFCKFRRTSSGDFFLRSGSFGFKGRFWPDQGWVSVSR